MKPRMSVARCCCPRPGAPGGESYDAVNSGVFDPTAAGAGVDQPAQMGVFVPGVGSGTVRNSGFYWWGNQPPSNDQGWQVPQGATVTLGTITIPDLSVTTADPVQQGNAYYSRGSAGTTLPPPPVDGTYFARGLIRGVLLPDTPEPTNLTDMNALPRTVAEVPWQLSVTIGNGGATFVSQFVEDDTYTTPSLVTIIQEIVDQATWLPGNGAMILLDEENSDEGVGGNPTTDHWGINSLHAPKVPSLVSIEIAWI